jgi:hypothetical protein
MPIKLTPISHGVLCHGHAWEIVDEDAVAKLIALVAVGQSRHAAKILASSNPTPAVDISKSAAQAAIAMLTAPSPGDPWHRDGWMFQVMSWIAAHRAMPEALLKAPQMILAEKGIDGLRVDLEAKSGTATSVVIFEDKATTNPRSTIREEVWPALELFEKGAKDNVLLAELITLLQSKPGIDVDPVIKNVLWQRDRCFRVSITTDDSYSTAAARKKLFKGFDAAVTGKTKRRGAETLQLAAMRAWMSSIASKAITAINTMV